MPNILILGGDGIGPEIMTEAKRVLSCFQNELSFTFIEKPIGGAAIDTHGSPFPKETEEAALQADAVLLGAVGGAKWDGLPLAERPEKGLLAIRKTLGLYANLRPLTIWPQLVGFSPLRPERLKDVSFVIVRELTGDVYFGEPRGFKEENGQRSAFNTMIYTEEEIRRIAKVAFDLARKRNKRVCSIDKSNVLESMRLWREIVENTHREYPDIALSHLYVDNASMQIIRQPSSFDVMLTPNMFGDILSDEAAVLSGSLGLLPSASLGGQSALYEPIHGSAPDIAGRGLANPIGMILSVAMMLDHSFHRPDLALKIQKAVSTVLDAGLRTADFWNEGTEKVSTSQMGSAIEKEITSDIVGVRK
ncbi:MAG: 3-isopropylmalate dehydrogenase [Alphaproteobacteria bacterium]|nr:3-isopropylmalate dehydrogenase [Alphaproteobacteria bacterium]